MPAPAMEKQSVERNAYLTGVADLYAGEVFGEALASRWLALSSGPDQKYKLALFLQLESEAKVRLRPLLARHGLDLVEDERQRSVGAADAERFASLPWKVAMTRLAELALPYLQRYQALLGAATAEDAPMVSFMVSHEQALISFCTREAAGDEFSDRDLLSMLSYPPARAGGCC